jgi:hypothetical protein
MEKYLCEEGGWSSLKENWRRRAGRLWHIRQRRMGAFTFLGTIPRVPQRLKSSGSFFDVVKSVCLAKRILSRLPVTEEIKFIT